MARVWVGRATWVAAAIVAVAWGGAVWRDLGLEARDHDLWSAVQRGDIDATRRLLRAGADPGLRSVGKSDGSTTLHVTALFGDRPEMVAVLIAHGASINARTGSEETPLHVAAEGGRAATMRLLLGTGAHVGAPDDIGRMPLHAASSSGQAEAARLLLEEGASINARDSRGRTPLGTAIDSRRRVAGSGGRADGFDATIALLRQHAARE